MQVLNSDRFPARTPVRPDIDYGARAKIGVIVPSGNIATEPQFRAMLPKGVAPFFTRATLTTTDGDGLMQMAKRVDQDVQLLVDAKVDIVFFHCTAITTFAEGSDDDILSRIAAVTDTPASATSKGIVAALKALKAKRVVLITPYTADINAREVAFLKRNGAEVIHETGLGIPDSPGMFAVTPEQWIDYALQNRRDDADLYFLSCAAVRTAEVIETLEAELGRPVITSNLLGAWHAMRTIGVTDRVDGFGHLLANY
jgi:maleate isomerase